MVGDTGVDRAHAAPRKPPRSLATVAEVLESLAAIQAQEAAISASLSSLLSSQEPISTSLARLTALEPQIEESLLEAELFSTKVGVTAQTADRVGSRVRVLDEEMRRIRSSIEHVSMVIELKSSLQMAQSSMEAGDYDSAARHCARAMAIPSEVARGDFAEAVVPTAASPFPPNESLQLLREQLLSVFSREFISAARVRDEATASKFFKLFPLVGWEREGLEAYADFVVDIVRNRPTPAIKASSPLYYITMLTALLEHVAHIVDNHQLVVEKHYGAGKMIPVVIKLLDECAFVIKRYLQGWEEERAVKRKLSEIMGHADVAVAAKNESSNPPDQELFDVREIDKLVSEIATMASRWALFQHFLFDHLALDENVSPHGKEEPSDVILSHECRRIFDNLLDTCYLPLELQYLRNIIESAHQLARSSNDNGVMTTTAPDDVFYILKIVISRLLTTGRTPFVTRALESIRSLVDVQYLGSVKKKLDQVYSGSQTGSSAGSRAEKAEKDAKMTYIIHLNDLDLSTLHTDRLVTEVLNALRSNSTYLPHEFSDLELEIRRFNDTTRKLRYMLKVGIEQLFNQLVRPRLRQLVVEIYRDVSYNLTEETYAVAEARELLPRRFMKAWESLLDGYRDALTDANYRIFQTMAVEAVVRPWEKAILGMKFTELGAIRFDHDIRAVVTYLSSQTAFSDAREKFQRLQHICTLLNLDIDDDLEEFYGSSGIAWKLSLSEARSVMAIRV